jgi:hypothetical protein
MISIHSSPVHARALCTTAFALVTLFTCVSGAQPPATGDHSMFNGGWTLNKELSTSPPAGAEGFRGGQGREGGRGGPGGRGGGGGFPGGGAGGPGGRPGGSPMDPEAIKKMQAMMQEIMEPSRRWIVTVGDESITFVDTDGRSRRFMTTGKKEKHQIQSGTLETKTKWDGPQLRQEVELGGGTKIVRSFSVSPETHQLIVLITVSGEAGRRPSPMRLVYEPDGR